MNTEAMQETVAEFRRFNRFHTRLLGLFDKRLLGLPLTLAEARTLYEIAGEPGISAVGLSQTTGMDRGQLSRIINTLIKEGLIDREGEPGGRKPLPLRVTAKGKKLCRKIDEAADSHAAGLLGKLDERQIDRLRGALAQARALLENRDDTSEEVIIREAGYTDLGWIITRHGELYGRECGFGDDFARYVLLGLAEYAQADRSDSRVWMAETDGSKVGSIGIVGREGERAQLRWLIVEPFARGLNIGRRLVGTAIDFCREQNLREIYLWTVDSLHPAKALYTSFGFTFSDSKPGAMGGVPVTEELWRLDLRQG